MAEQFFVGQRVKLTDISLMAWGKKTRQEFSGLLTISAITDGKVTLLNDQGEEFTCSASFIRKV